MERLTKRENGHAHYPRCFEESCGGMGCRTEDCEFKDEICERLAAYEDTELTPEEVLSMSGEWCAMMTALNSIGGGYTRLRELAEADKAGRVVVLPVKPVLTPILSSMLYIIEDGDIYEDALYEAVVGMSRNGEMNVVYTTLSDQITFSKSGYESTACIYDENCMVPVAITKAPQSWCYVEAMKDG